VTDETPIRRRHVVAAQRDVCLVIDTTGDEVALFVDDRVQVTLSHADARALGVQLLLASHDAKDRETR